MSINLVGTFHNSEPPVGNDSLDFFGDRDGEKRVALLGLRVKAARDNASISRYLGQLVEQARARDGIYERSMRAALKFQPLAFPKNTRYLSRDKANGRTDIR